MPDWYHTHWRIMKRELIQNSLDHAEDLFTAAGSSDPLTSKIVKVQFLQPLIQRLESRARQEFLGEGKKDQREKTGSGFWGHALRLLGDPEKLTAKLNRSRQKLAQEDKAVLATVLSDYLWEARAELRENTSPVEQTTARRATWRRIEDFSNNVAKKGGRLADCTSHTHLQAVMIEIRHYIAEHPTEKNLPQAKKDTRFLRKLADYFQDFHPAWSQAVNVDDLDYSIDIRSLILDTEHQESINTLSVQLAECLNKLKADALWAWETITGHFGIEVQTAENVDQKTHKRLLREGLDFLQECLGGHANSPFQK